MSSGHTICFDVSYVQHRRAGIGNATLRYLESALSVDTVNRYVLHGWSYGIDRKCLALYAAANVAVRARAIPGAAKRFYWLRLPFPPIERIVGEVDLFHSLDPILPPTRSCKTVATTYDLCYLRFPEFFERRVIRWGRSLPASLERAGRIIVPSVQTQTDLVEMLGVPEEKIVRIAIPPAPVFSCTNASGEKEAVQRRFHLDAPFALTVGTLEPRKNLLGLMRAFEICVSAGSMDLDLVVVGKNGWRFGPILDAMKRSPAARRIRRLEYVPEKDLASLYRLAEMVIYPSFFEGYGMPVVEAMASGTPVITSNVSSMKELGEGAALLVDPRNSEELAHAIVSLLHDEDRRHSLRRSGLEKASRLNRESVGRAVLDAYASLLGC